MSTISPGSMSRTNSAPMSSNAQVSDDTTQVGAPPPAAGTFPSTSGRKPMGSRTAMTMSSERKTSE